MSYTVPIQTGLYISIFIHVDIVIKVDKAAVLEGPKGDNRKYRQSQANKDRILNSYAGLLLSLTFLVKLALFLCLSFIPNSENFPEVFTTY